MRGEQLGLLKAVAFAAILKLERQRKRAVVACWLLGRTERSRTQMLRYDEGD